MEQSSSPTPVTDAGNAAANSAMDHMRDQAAGEDRGFTPQELAQFHSHAAQAAIHSRQTLEQHGPHAFDAVGARFVGIGRLGGPAGENLSTEELHAHAGWLAEHVAREDEGRAR